MLVPLNRPSAPPRKIGAGVKIINLIFRAIGFAFNICFGWLGWLLARSTECKFEAEVRRELYFLFESYRARIVSSKTCRYAKTITIEFGDVRLRISRHHDETAFSVASVFAADHWEAFQLIVSGVTVWGSAAAPFTNDLPTFAPILKKSISFLQQALSKDNVHATLSKAIEAENEGIDEYAACARANGVEPLLYSSPSTKTP